MVKYLHNSRNARFINEDKELQMVIAHELAHNIEGHIEKRQIIIY